MAWTQPHAPDRLRDRPLGTSSRQWPAVVNAAAAALLGFATAWATRATDGGSSLQAAILGVAQALLTLGATFGLDWSAVQVASVMGFVAVLTSA
ncbi:hypothetical protein [Herbidospora yilanensis]|uniref:hypothetical protein n=1 Tax=Herbidospora yilanensis TaxID=354426 RepID=UPI0007836143|nr:hypothetical protein [Herbidospora yilanensis]